MKAKVIQTSCKTVHKGIRLCLRRLRTELTVAKAEFPHTMAIIPTKAVPKYSKEVPMD